MLPTCCPAGKFKPIIFARLELDLHRVFWEVQNRGGYDAVCRGKQWKVCPLSQCILCML